MNTKLLPAIILLLFITGCSAVRKSTQTIDDVYYSPMNGSPAYVATPVNTTDDYYEPLMSIGDPRWSNYGYVNTYNPYYYGFNNNYYFNDYYNNYYCSYPLYTPIFYLPVAPTISMPRRTNLNAYNTKYNNSNQTTQNRPNTLKQQPSAVNKQSGVSRFFQQLFTPVSDNNTTYSNENYPNGNANATNNNTNNSSSNANNTNYDNRNYNPPSSNSSSSGGGGGGTARRH